VRRSRRSGRLAGTSFRARVRLFPLAGIGIAVRFVCQQDRCLLAGCALDHLPRPAGLVARVAGAAALVGVLVAGVIPYQWRALHDSYAGLEEAARWLADTVPPALA
jgi:hypothetical protein